MITTSIYIALKKAIDDLGVDILKSPTLVSVLSDYHAFDVHDPLLVEKKTVITALVSNGYMNKLTKWQKQSDSLWQAEDAQWIEQLCKKQGLKRNIVGMIADVMKEAVGLEVVFTEFSDVKKMLSSEIKKYKDALKRLVTVYTDRLGIKGAFYSITANTELYRYEGRIKILAQNANDCTYNDRWIALEKEKILILNSCNPQQKTKIINDTITHGLSEYSQIMEQQKKIGKKNMGIFEDSIINRLRIIAENVNYAYKLSSQDVQLDVALDVKSAKEEVSKYIQQQKVQAEFDKAKSEYKQLLRDALVLETDCLGLSTAYFNYDRENDIKSLEKKIVSYAKELSVSSNMRDRFNTEKNLLINKYTSSEEEKSSVARKVLAEDVLAYEESIKEQILQGKKGKKVFEDTTNLMDLAERINHAFEITRDKKRIDVNKDVEAAKTNMRTFRRKRFLLISVTVAIILTIVVCITVDRVNYNRHRIEIESFNNTIAEGDEALNNNDPAKALCLYMEADTKYLPNYRQEEFRQIAFDKQEAAAEKVVNVFSRKISAALKEGNCVEAKNIFNSFLLTQMPECIDKISLGKEFEDNIYHCVIQNRNNLLVNIFKSKGKFTEEEKAEIDDLLYCYPDDYYLRMIKDKMK